MKPEEVRNLNWVKVEDWGEITATYEDRNGSLISENDIIAFVENIFRDVARKLDIPAKKVLPIMKAENNAFFQIKAEIFSNYEAIGSQSEEFLGLKKLLRVPDVYFSDKRKITLDTLIEEINKLSDEDKKKIIDALSLEVETNFLCDSEKVIKDFENLPDVEKFNVMKYLGLFEIKIERIPK